MRGLFVAIGLVATLAGCSASTSEPVVGPSGKAMREAKCSGSPNACYKAAASVCKGPYQVLDSSSNAGGLVADILPGPVTWYRMSYQCGPSDGRLPSFDFRGPRHVVPSVTTTSCNRFGNNVTCTSYWGTRDARQTTQKRLT